MNTGDKRPDEDEARQAGAPDSAETSPGATQADATPDAAQPDSAPAEPSAQTSAGPEAAGSETAESERAAPPPPRRSSSLSSRLLTLLVALIAGAAGALYFGPQIAPSLPAPVAAYLTPAGDAQADAGLSARLEQVGATTDAVASRLDALEDAVRDASETAGPAPETLSRLDSLEEQVGSLRASLEQAMAGGGADPAAVAGMRAEVQAAAAAIDRQAEALSAVEAALGAQQDEIDALAGELGAINASGGTDVSGLADQIAALQAARAADIEARADLASAAEDARRAATLSESFAVIDRAMTFGEPFTGALEAARGATDVAPPEALVKAAQDGAPTREALKARFPEAAYDAISASLEQEAAEDDPGMLSSVLARFEARVTGLPNEPIPGDSVPAKLSRARAALLTGDIDTAVATVQALPEAAQAAMADWTEGAILRSDADVALRQWRAEVKRGL